MTPGFPYEELPPGPAQPDGPAEKIDRLVVYVAYDGETEEVDVQWDDWDQSVVVELLRRAADGLEGAAGSSPDGAD